MSEADTAVEAAPEVATETEVEPASWQEMAGLSDDPTAAKYESVGELFNAYKEASSMIGNSVRFPTKEAGEEDIAKFNQQMLDRGFHRAPDRDDLDGVRGIQRQLGMPEEPSKYEFGEVEGYTSDPESEGAFKATAHELGLTQDQANGVFNWLAGSISEQTAAQDKAAQESLQALKGEWGQAFDHKVAQAQNTAKMLESRVPGISDYLDQMAQTGYDANMIRLMDVVAEALGETGAQMPQGVSPGMTPREAQQRIEDAQSNPDHWWHKDPDMLTDSQVQQRVEWMKAAFGG